MTRNAVSAGPRDPPGPGVCPEGGCGRDPLLAPAPALAPCRKRPSLLDSLCWGRGGVGRSRPAAPPAPCASCPVQRGGNARETPNSRGAGWALPPQLGGVSGAGWVPRPSKSPPSIGRGGKGEFAGGSLSAAPVAPRRSGCLDPPGARARDPGCRFSSTGKRAEGGDRVQAAPTPLSQAPAGHGHSGAAAGCSPGSPRPG